MTPTCAPIKISELNEALLRDKLFLSSLVIWGINDHILKYTHPSEVTGKLSDVTSLICAPILLFIVILFVYSRAHRLTESTKNFITQSQSIKLMTLCATCMGAIMIGININEHWASAYKLGLALMQWPFLATKYLLFYGLTPPLPTVHLTMDPSDSWTAPSALVSLLIQQRAHKSLI